MDTRGNDTLREMLAAEYAVGTLRGAARRRFERLARDDEGLRLLTAQWSERLAPLLDRMPSRVPPQRVWDAIEARLPGFAARRAEAAASSASWWDRLAFWRGLAGAMTAVAVAAVGVAVLRPPAPPAPTPEPRIVRVPTAPAAIATLLDPRTNQPVAVVLTAASGSEVTVRVVAGVDVPDGKVLQLWLAPRDSDALLSMGVLPGDPRRAAAQVRSIDPATLRRAKAFGLSLEPKGGSPQPTKVLGLGGLVAVSG